MADPLRLPQDALPRQRCAPRRAWLAVGSGHALLLWFALHGVPQSHTAASRVGAARPQQAAVLQVSLLIDPAPDPAPNPAPFRLSLAPKAVLASAPTTPKTAAPAPSSVDAQLRVADPLPAGAAESPAPGHASAPTATPPTAAPADTVLARTDHRQCPPAPYPAALHERGIEGAATVRVRVDAQGRAAEVRLVNGSGWRLFDDAAVQRAQGCRFFPALRGGEPVDSWVEFAVRFALTG